MKLVVYYDGLCQLCSREMQYFHGVRGATEQIAFVDYTEPGFDPRAEGLDREALDRWMHVRLPDGRVVVGADAVIAFWSAVPGWSWLGRLAGCWLVRPVFRLWYYGFAKVRPYLPRRKQSCPLRRPVS